MELERQREEKRDKSASYSQGLREIKNYKMFLQLPDGAGVEQLNSVIVVPRPAQFDT